MSQIIRLSLRTAAAVTFSTTIGFLFVALFWQLCRGLSPAVPVFAFIAALSLLVSTIYGSVTAGAKLNWNAVASGGAVGVVAMGGWWLNQTSLPSPLPQSIVIPLMLSSLTAAAMVRTFPSRLYSTSRFVFGIHILQGMFLFGVVLPACIVWKWPRPFAAALITSAFVLWQFWGGCPLTMAENVLRMREGRPTIPPEEGCIKDVLDQWGVPVWGHAIAMALHGIGFCLCGWWGIEWLMSIFSRG